ncbi:phytanoyl-CoA dioxygenase family protein [Burkholderia pseudomallei]|nr:phytanoyl-CoA dioxygenase family protein [Burkholderia pseudomallei]ABN82558.1 phytanoyl-CoA dioxygenase family protein [Burkholderia pseudomallei 668]AJX87933.1 phytanoyl-CoA dioxygenase family protein [Burkholderia pseudomallei]APY98196.1 mitomycin antibiotic biosynthesis protein [Burkholderia pseudomallei]APZ11779.1 mitomycin antibiotic biosynthesis protein [Burkholderia pseudomallei]KGD47741.1 phytanoyl-CoA dioxygenase family protein [Burkholderia pseudomallei]
MSFHLTDEEVAVFDENGFLVVRDLLDAEALASMHAAIDEIIGSANDVREVAELEPSDASIIRRIWQPSKRHAAFRAIQEDPRIVDRIESLIGPDIVFHHSKLNMKGPRVGSPVEWHQDFSYYPHTNPKLVACLVYLDDADEDNACLRVLAGSHRASIYDHTEHGQFRGKVAAENLPAGYAEMTAAGRAGTVVFLHCKVLHRSDANRSAHYRRCFIPAYRAADALPIYYGPHAAHNEPGTYLLRGQRRPVALGEAGEYPLPITEKAFNSLYALQQGEHLLADELHARSSGYATHARAAAQK